MESSDGQTSSMMRTVRQEQGLIGAHGCRAEGEQREKSADAITCSRSGLFSSSSPVTHSFRLAVAHALSALSPPLSQLRQNALSASWRTKRRSSAPARPSPPLPVRPVHEHGSRRTGNVDDGGIQTARDGDGSVFFSFPSRRPGRAGCSNGNAADRRQLLVLPHHHTRKQRCSSVTCARFLPSVNVRALPVLHACRR
jgi:hypothetical protein